MVKLRGTETYPIYFGARPEILRIAGDLRRNMTKVEKLLWEQLRQRKIDGYRFRRQHPLNEFIVDFFCYEAMLVIELDGDVHDSDFQAERDLERTKILNQLGLTILRFSNKEVHQNITQVISTIREKIKTITLKKQTQQSQQ
jgi:very-short-patch-repair endonuclease